MADETEDFTDLDKSLGVTGVKGIKGRRFMKKSGPKQKRTYEAGIGPKKLSMIELSALGHSQLAISRILNVHRNTIRKWMIEVKPLIDEAHADMPSIQLAIDRVRTMVPDALDVYDKNLKSPKAKVRYPVARDILISEGVLRDRKTVEHDDTNRSTEDLIKEFQYLSEIGEEIISTPKEENGGTGSDD